MKEQLEKKNTKYGKSIAFVGEYNALLFRFRCHKNILSQAEWKPHAVPTLVTKDTWLGMSTDVCYAKILRWVQMKVVAN